MKNTCVIALVLLGCVDRGPGPQAKKIERSYIRENQLKEVPQGIQQLDVDLGGKVTYVGNRVLYIDGKDAATPLAPGGTIRVMHYWQVKEPPGANWRVFAFVRGAPGTADFMSLQPTDMQIGHPIKKWKAGEIIQDVQDIVLRPDWRSPQATLYIGLVEDGGHQLGDRMKASGPHVVDRAVVARTVEVDLSKAPPPPGTVHVPRAAGPITIDGVVNDPGWMTAATSPELVTADSSPEPVGRATARMTWDDQYLYVFVQVIDTDVHSPYKQKDEPLWKADCVELFIDADGNRTGYVELQVNPNNATFDSWFQTTRAQPGDEAWDAQMQTAVKVRGTPDKGGDADQGWDVEIAIPLAAVKGKHESMAVGVPPQVGDKWRLNIVRVDYRSGGGAPAVASWNRISYADFHALERMLTVVFADQQGAITPTPPGAAPLTPGVGSAAPPPGAGSAAPAPGSGSAAPVPGEGAKAPARGSGSAAIAPATGSAERGSVPPTPPAPGSAAPAGPTRPTGSASPAGSSTSTGSASPMGASASPRAGKSTGAAASTGAATSIRVQDSPAVIRRQAGSAATGSAATGTSQAP